MKKSDEKRERGFIWANRAWYAKVAGVENGLVYFGIYDEYGGAEGEMAMAWIDICSRKVPHLRAFGDSWKGLACFTDVIEAMAKTDGRNITEEAFVKILKDCGFRDLTKYTDETEADDAAE
jgi:hypothetical protein